MGKAHLGIETLADLLSGEIEDDELRRVVIPHLLGRCPVCRGRVEGIRRLQERVGHWNESVVVRESREAPRLLARLLRIPAEKRLSRLAGEEGFHTWGLCHLLLERSRRCLCADAGEASELAELAVAVSEHLGVEAYHPEWVADLQARAWAHLGNALRVLGELRGADSALRRARGLLERGCGDRPGVQAEVLDLVASLRLSQRRFDEAIELLGQVMELHREAGDLHRVGRAMLGQAKALEENDRPEEAAALLAEVPALLDPEREPRLPVYARHNLLCTLVTAGRFSEARELLPEVEALLADAPEVDRLRLRWAAGRIAHGLGETAQAERLLTEVRDAFVSRLLGLDAALASLDLAVLYAEAGRLEELEKVAAETLPLFQARDLHREALLALVLFQRAVEQRTVTLELIHEMAELIRRPSPAKPR